jgi:hypothetical protein
VAYRATMVCRCRVCACTNALSAPSSSDFRNRVRVRAQSTRARRAYRIKAVGCGPLPPAPCGDSVGTLPAPAICCNARARTRQRRLLHHDVCAAVRLGDAGRTAICAQTRLASPKSDRCDAMLRLLLPIALVQSRVDYTLLDQRSIVHNCVWNLSLGFQEVF